MANRENWAYDAQTETILASGAVRAVGGTHRLHMEAEFTPLYDKLLHLAPKPVAFRRVRLV